MKTHTLFGQLATRFSTSPENLATEALSYILDTSNTAKRSLRKSMDFRKWSGDPNHSRLDQRS